jgi:hypothetical protein
VLSLFNFFWVLVVHACNPSYSGSRDQEDHSKKNKNKQTKNPTFFLVVSAKVVDLSDLA